LTFGNRVPIVRALFSLVTVVVTLALAQLPAASQTLAPSWYQQSPATSPPPRYIHAMAYDQAHSQVLLFGGFGGGYLNDTWLWNGSTWSQANPTSSPSPRAAPEMAYDAAHNQVVLFGGLASASSRLGDTWLWDGTTWTQATPANSPPPRASATMVYYPGYGVLLFGGVSASGFDLNDTWLWNGANWTQLTPAASPSPRADYGMVYDPNLAEVLLFGGSSSGTDLNDTWLWNGQTWSQLVTATTPPARDAQGMTYDPALGQIVMFGGYNGSFLNDTWEFGTVNGGTSWAQAATAANPSGRYAPNAVVYDAAQKQVILFGGLGTGNDLNDTWQFGLPGNFGNVNVCPAGQTSPSPCSETLAFTYNIATATTFGPTQVLTQGSSGLDFQLASGSTCTGTIPPGTCSVSVTISPLAPGLRSGAVQLFDNNGHQLISSPIEGVGQGPAAAFGPGIRSSVNVGNLSQPKGVLADAGGSLFISDTGLREVLKIAPGGARSTVGIGLNYPQEMAEDGAGNLFIADNNLNQVVEVPAGCTSSSCQHVLGSNLRSQLGVAVDGAGDLFVGDFLDGEVVESPAGCTSAACQTVVYHPAGSNPVGLAVDATGDLFVADFGLRQIAKIPPGCTTASCQLTIGQGWSQPEAVAVDAAGDVFVADAGLDAVVEVPAGCTVASCQVTVQSGVAPYGLAVDQQGNVFIPDLYSSQVKEVNRSQPPSLTFASTNVGSTSTDSPQSFSLQNIGNQTLNAASSGILVGGPNFAQVAGSGMPADCTATFALAPGLACNVSIDFDPTVGGNPLSSKAVFTDNALNATAANQIVGLSGTGIAVQFTVSGTVTGLTGSGLVLQDTRGTTVNVTGNNPFTFTDTYLTGAPYSVTILSQPSGQSCSVVNGSGTIANANVANVQVTCANLLFYPITISEVGTGTGAVGDNQGQITCSEANGATTGTCSASYVSGTLVTLTAKASGTSTFLGWGGVCASSGTNPTCSLTIAQAANATASFVNQNFGNINVCPAGVNAAGPCTTTLPVTFNLASTTAIGAVQVVTQGISGLDFTPGSGSSCTGTIAGGSSCSVNVNFTPIAPGLRVGAVELFDNNANLIASTPVYGVGQGSAISFAPGVQTTVPTTGLHYNVGVAVDAVGNTFIADYGAGKVVKVTPGGVQTTVPATGLSAPIGVAVDGAGNVYIVDLNLPYVVKVTPTGAQTTLGSGLNYPIGIALDATGDIFIGDQNNNRVEELSASGIQTTVPTTGLSQPWGVAVDAQGNVFVADGGNSRVVKVTPGGVQSTVPANGLSQPYGVAVDAAGDLYIADPLNKRIVEIPVGGAPQTTVGSGLNYPSGVTLDGAGDVFIGDQGSGQVVEVNRTQPPSFTFAVTNVGSTSTDSPEAAAIQNVGNQPLQGSLTLNLGSGFTENVAPDCSTAFPLAPGGTCNESFSFSPPSATFFSGTAVFTYNTFGASAFSTQTVTLSGTGATAGVAGTVAVPNVVGLAQTAVSSPLVTAGLSLGTITTSSSSTVPSGSVIDQNPEPGTQVNVGTAVNLLVSTGIAQPASPNPLSLNNNYFLTGDYVSAGVTLRGTGVNGTATGNITIPTYNQNATNGVPPGADIIDAFLYWETLENTPSASSTNATFNGYSVTGQQIGTDIPNYVDGQFTGTIRAYRADVNIYLPIGTNGVRIVSGNYTVGLPDSGGTGLPLTQGASLVILYRVLSPNFPLKSVVIYDGAALPTSAESQVVQGFYDAVGGASGTGKSTTLFATGGTWNNSLNPAVTLGQSSQYSAPLSPANAYAAVILSTPVNNSDNDGILDAWKTGPSSTDFHAGQPGYYDVKTGTWVGLAGAKHGERNLFVQLDYMCGAVLANGSCDPTQENLFPSPDANGQDPLAMVQQAFAASGVALHLTIGNAIPESTCQDNLSTTPAQLCQFPNEPGVIGWKNSIEFAKLYPRNLLACITGGDCTTRYPYGQKDSYHYVLFGHSLAIPAWNTPYGTLTSINVVNGVTTVTTVDRGTGINACPSRITIEGVLGNPALNGVYNTSGCADTKTITFATPGVPNWSYPNNILPEPVIGLTSGKVTSISGYSDLGGADSAVTLGLWLTAPNQNMAQRANVLAGTMFHEIGHTLGLSHGGLYFDTPGTYIPTFDANCKPNYQSIMNYLFQLDLLGPNQSLAFSNQSLLPINENTAGSITQLTDASGDAATFPTSAWYVPWTTGSSVSPATLHCDGTPLNGEQGYRVDSSIAPVSPAWSNGQDLSFIGAIQSNERGYNDLANLDLRQVGAVGGEFASLASLLSFGSSVAPLNISAGGSASLGSGGTITLGSGGTVTLGSGGTFTLGSGGTVTLGSGGTVTLGSGGTVTLGSGGTVTAGAGGTVTLGSGGTVTLGSGGTITLGSGGTITLGSGGTITLGSGGTIALGSGGSVTIPSTGGSYTIDGNGGTVTLGSGGTLALGSSGTVTLGSGGTFALGSGGTLTLGSGGTVTLGSGGTVALGSGGTLALGSGGTFTLGSGGTLALGSGGTVTLGSGGTVTLGSGGTVTLGSGGTNALGSGGTVTLGSGGEATLGAGGTVTLGSGGTMTLGSGGTVTLGSGGTVTLGSGGTVTLGSGGTFTLGSGGTFTLGSGGTFTLGSGGTFTLGSGGTYTLGSGGTFTLGSGGTVTLGSGGTVTLGSGGTVTLGSGGTFALGSGGTFTLGSGGTFALGSGGTVTLGSGGTVTLGSGGVVTLGTGGNVNLGIGTSPSLGTTNNVTPGSGGPTSTELSYETANSVVRPPGSPSETSTPAGVLVTWQAPAFGVVQTYTVYRSSNGATPIVIGSVSGINGNPPATQFLDTNPDLTSKTVVYTITTTLVPDTAGPSRQSVPSTPAVLKNNQTIVLGPLPSSVIITNPPTVTATSMANGAPSGLQVLFTASGSCTIASRSIANNVSSATLTLMIGSCTITASQPGTTAFNAANSVSETFMVLPQGSTTQSQTINFAPLPNVQYGSSFTPSATSSSQLPVSFTAFGPCTASGTTTGVGICKITASAPSNSTYSAASLTQSFTIEPAVLKVTANNLTSVYGQALPALTYTYSGFISPDTASVVSGAPALSTTAIPTSNAGNYPITVSTGTLATANYSFLYVNGALTVQPANQSALTLTTTSPLTFGQSEILKATGGSTGGLVTYSLVAGSSCTLSGAQLTATSGTGACQVTATMAGNSNYNPVTSAPANTVTLTKASQTINFTTNPPATAAYNSIFTVAATSTSGGAVNFTIAGSCTNSGATFTMTSGAGSCSVIANQAGNANYAAAAQNTKSVTASLAAPVVTWLAPPAIVYGYPLTANQLDATASVAGSFAYTPALGTVLGIGTQTLSVTFTPTNSADYSSVTTTVHLTVNAPTVSIGISNQTQTYQQWTNFVIGPIFTGSRIPTGTVTLYDNGTALTTLTLGGNGLAYYTAGPFNVGPNVLSATYSGNSYFAAGASSPVTVTVLPAPVNFQASCWGAQVYGTAYQCTVNLSASTSTTPGGVITYSFDGGAAVSVPIVNGNAPFTLPALPSAGSHTLVLNYAAQGNFAAAGPLKESFTTQPGQTELYITPSSYYLASGSSLTISGTANTPSSGIPTGTVTLYDGKTALGPATISSTGAISYRVSTISKGTHSYYLSYAGAANYSAANSGTATVTAY
jgi:sugar lactone lactonase YvrE